MPQEVAVRQELRIDYETDPYAGTEQIRYEPGLLPNGSEDASTERETKLGTIMARLEALRDTVHRLVVMACDGDPRGGRGVEEKMADLAEALLPEQGFTKLIAPRVDVLARTRGVLAGIPWEMIEERYFFCPQDPEHELRTLRDPHHGREPHCTVCGEQMKLAEQKLGIARSLSYAVRPSEARALPHQGCFLAIIDPLGDLCDRCRPTGRCAAENTDALLALLRECFGESLWVLSRSAATASAVRRAISSRDVVGIYYFGHGVVPARGGEGSLVLANGTPLYANEILHCRPAAPFVFLNACVSAVVNGQWIIDRKFDSVTHAFAKGAAKTCVGTLWQVVNTQATAAALEFFRLMLVERRSAAEALRAIRIRSLERYQAGDPDTVWMSYRLFGRDLSYRLTPAAYGPQQPPAAAHAAPAPAEQLPPLFDDRVLDLGAFAFPARPVLRRAVDRRNAQQRARVSLEDFVAGLLARGLLTRRLCANANRDPDALCDDLCAAELGRHDPSVPAPAGDAGLSADDVHPGLLDLFSRACRLRNVNVAGRRAGLPISERDLLLALLGNGAAWPTSLTSFLPPAHESRRFLEEAIGREIDENGALTLNDLEPGARRVVAHAHELAVQRGRCPIPNRLLLAAFFENEQRWAWRACEAHPELRANPVLLRELMIASVDTRQQEDFLLSEAACERIVTPTVDLARQWTRDQGRQEVDEPTLFRAFIRETTPALKDALENLDQPIRLDALCDALLPGTATPPATPTTGSLPGIPTAHGQADLSNTARAFVTSAEEWALAQGADVLRPPHLFAALVGDELTPLAQALWQQNADPQWVKRQILFRTGPAGPQARGAPPEGHSRLVERILSRAVALARSEGRRVAEYTHILRAFFTADNGGVTEELRQLGLAPPVLPPPSVH